MWVIDKISHTECCSCALCSQICSHNAINMVYNDEGFLYPSRNESKCNNCEVCISTCPIINESKLKNKGRSTVYAAQNKDTEQNSS